MQSAAIIGHKVLNNARGWKPVKKFDPRLKLHQALVSGFPIEVFSNLISKGQDIEATDHDGQTPLHLAAFLDLKLHVQVLINNRADLDSKDQKGNTPVHYASELNHCECLKLLIDNGASVNLTNIDGRTPLHLAAENRNAKVVGMLLDVEWVKFDVGDLQEPPVRPFDLALVNGDWRSVKMFIIRGADVNKKTPFGKPIFVAIKTGRTEMIKVLLKFKVKLSITDQDGNSPLHLAVTEQVIGIVKFLVNESSDNINAVNGRGKTALHLAALLKKTEIVSILINAGANCLIQDDSGSTPLHEICRCKYPNFLEAMLVMRKLGKGTDFNIVNNFGETPIYIAIRQKNKKLVLLLRFYYPDMESTLHDTILSGDVEMTSKLLHESNEESSPSKSNFFNVFFLSFRSILVQNVLLGTRPWFLANPLKLNPPSR